MARANSLANLVDAFARFPGVGEKTAERLAAYFVNADPQFANQFIQLLKQAKERIKFCRRCFDLTEENPCRICSDSKRDESLICVVERSQDLQSIERTGGYKGLYHVLHGAIAPMDGTHLDNLKVKELLQRIKREEVREVILGTNHNVEGDATSHYLVERLSALNKPHLKITRLASGIPLGGSLTHADTGTLSRALAARAKF